MNKLWTITFMAIFFGGTAAAQKATKHETATMTQDQRLTRETNRKSKKGKKKLSMRKRVRIDQHQDHKARRIRRG